MTPSSTKSLVPKSLATAALAGTLILTLAGCAAGSSEAHHAASGGFIAEFVLGLWHGFIAPLTLIVEVINALLPHVIPWKPRLFETGAGVAYDVASSSPSPAAPTSGSTAAAASGGARTYTYPLAGKE